MTQGKMEEGVRVVPLVPTEEMNVAGIQALNDHTSLFFDGSEVVEPGASNAIYSAMIAAAPQPATLGVPVATEGVPSDVRLRMYYPIVMPLDANGIGPASEADGEIRKLTWEVWDQFCDTFGTFNCLADAMQEAERLNGLHYTSPPNAEPAPVVRVTDAQVQALAASLQRITSIVDGLYGYLDLGPSSQEGLKDNWTQWCAEKEKAWGASFAALSLPVEGAAKEGVRS